MNSSTGSSSLDRLAAIEELRSWLDGQLDEAIVAARAARLTWAEIGQCFDLTRQGAWNRFNTVTAGLESTGVLAALPDDPNTWPDEHQD